MKWVSRSVITPVKLGPPQEPGARQQVEGTFLGVRETGRYENETCYDILTDDGTIVPLKGNASLEGQLFAPEDVGKRVQVTFRDFYETGHGDTRGRNYLVSVAEPDGDDPAPVVHK